MTVRVEVFPDLREVPTHVFQYCNRYLTLGSEGGMQETSRWLRMNRWEGTAPTAVAFEDDKPVGWMFNDHHKMVEMYVNPHKRNNGIAAAMLVELAAAMNVTLDRIKVYNTNAERALAKALRMKGANG